MVKEPYSDEFVVWARTVKTSKRAQTALQVLLENGTVTTSDLASVGYDHPPRAIMDLKDAGFAINQRMVTVNGRRMAEYTLEEVQTSGRNERAPIPREFRERLFAEYDYRCSVCGGKFIPRMLQADHRVPFYVGGETLPFRPHDFMPLCASDNRAKSMSCETCPNWMIRDPENCRMCYWANPEDYAHVAMREERRLDVTIQGKDVEYFERMARTAQRRGLSPVELFLENLRKQY